MSLPNEKPRNRALLLCSCALLAGLSGMLAYQWDEVKQSWRSWRNPPTSGQGYAGPPLPPVKDDALLSELAEATLAPQLPADDPAVWNQWRGPGRTGVASATNLMDTWPGRGPPLAWQKKLGESFAAFVGGPSRVYTIVREGEKEVVLCLDLNTGEEFWRHEYGCPAKVAMGNGPRSTPSLADGKLYTVGVAGIFHCLDAATGNVLWGRDLLKEFNAANLQWGVSFSPLVDGNLVFTNPGGPSGAALAAFNFDSGSPVWHSQGDGAGYSSPIGLTFGGVHQVLFLTNASLLGVEAETGKLLWKFAWPCTANAATPIPVAGQSKDGRPLQYVFISSNYNQGCALLKIEPDAGAFKARPVYKNGEMHNHFSTSVRHGEYLYGFNDSMLTCLNLRTGEAAWKQGGGFGKGSLLGVGDRLIVLGDKGKLGLVEADPGEYKEVASFKALSQRCWTVPVLIDGRLLIRDDEQVKCYDLRAK